MAAAVYAVTIGGKAATNVARKDEHTLTCTVAADTPVGKSKVTVTKDGTKLVEKDAAFEVTAPAAISKVEPVAGVPGTPVTITVDNTTLPA